MLVQVIVLSVSRHVSRWKFFLKTVTCGLKVLLGSRCGTESRISRLFAALSYCWYLPLIRAACTDACIPATQHYRAGCEIPAPQNYRDAKSRHLKTTGRNPAFQPSIPGRIWA